MIIVLLKSFTCRVVNNNVSVKYPLALKLALTNAFVSFFQPWLEQISVFIMCKVGILNCSVANCAEKVLIKTRPIFLMLKLTSFDKL